MLSSAGVCGAKESDRTVTVAVDANVASAGAGPHWHYNFFQLESMHVKRTSCIKRNNLKHPQILTYPFLHDCVLIRHIWHRREVVWQFAFSHEF